VGPDVLSSLRRDQPKSISEQLNTKNYEIYLNENEQNTQHNVYLVGEKHKKFGLNGDTTRGITTLSMMKFSITTLSITTNKMRHSGL